MSKRRLPSIPPKRREHADRQRRRSSSQQQSSGLPRLQKVLAGAGLGSRRKCEELIREGRVEIDRRTVTELGTRVDPSQQEIRVDGEPLPKPKRQYFMLNKPMGVVSTARDPAGRPRVTDLIPSHTRLFPVGRLDLSSEGLILLTNDGELANLLAHPRYEVEKTYLAQVAGAPSREELAKLEHGVHLAEGYAHAKQVRVKSRQKQSSTLEIVLDEGRNREVRRLLARVGHKVLRLKRIAVGSLRLGNLAAGEYRPLRADEVRELHDSALASKDRKSERPIDRQPDADRHASPRPLPPRPPEESKLSVPPTDVEPPRRRGTVIGEDFNSADTQRERTDSPRDLPSQRAPRPAIKPLIDVRRGIFPGRAVDDFDDDELDELNEAPAVPKRPTPAARKLPQRPKRPGRGRHPKAAKKAPPKRDSKPPRRRKERRR